MKSFKFRDLIIGVMLLLCANLSFSASTNRIVESDNDIHELVYGSNDLATGSYYILDNISPKVELPSANNVLFAKIVATTNHLFTTKGISIRKSWTHKLKFDNIYRKTGLSNSESVNNYSNSTYRIGICKAKISCQSDFKIGWNKAVNGVA